MFRRVRISSPLGHQKEGHAKRVLLFGFRSPSGNFHCSGEIHPPSAILRLAAALEHSSAGGRPFQTTTSSLGCGLIMGVSPGAVFPEAFALSKKIEGLTAQVNAHMHGQHAGIGYPPVPLFLKTEGSYIEKPLKNDILIPSSPATNTNV